MSIQSERIRPPEATGAGDPFPDAGTTGGKPIPRLRLTGAQRGGPTEPFFDIVALGLRMRETRKQYGWTRMDVERLSVGRWTATALGTYERGERAITAASLLALSDFYRVAVIDLMQPEEDPIASPIDGALIIDTRKLADSTRWPRLAQFVEAVQQARQGPRRRLVTLRRRDVPRLAAVHNHTPERFMSRLAKDGLIAGWMG